MRRALVWSACLSTSVLAAGCERLVHSGEYATTTEQRSEDYCSACVATDPAPRRPPCPPTSGDGDDGKVHVFAWRQLRMGASGWPAPPAESYDAGLDFDCSNRPEGGRPALCSPRVEQLPDGVHWEPLPHGIDNAFGRMVVAPAMKALGVSGDMLDQLLTIRAEQGTSSFLVLLSGWNGGPDDRKVSVRLLLGTAEKTAWDGTDTWSVYADGLDPDSPGGQLPEALFKTNSAWVRDGTLVATHEDERSAAVFLLNGQARYDFRVHHAVLTGRLTPAGLTDAVMAGKLLYRDLFWSSTNLADFLVGCNEGLMGKVDALLQQLIAAAPDLPPDSPSTALPVCDEISVGWAGSAFPARFGPRLPAGAQLGCPGR